MALTRITKGVIKPNENYDTHNINSTGIVTAIGLDVNGNGDISGNLNVGGVLTYEDVTSIDSVGLITARDGIFLPDNKKLEFGNQAGSSDFRIYHDGTRNVLAGFTGSDINIESYFGADVNIITNSNHYAIKCISNAQVELYHDNVKRLETSATGVSIPQDLDVDGHTNLDNVSIAGITTTTETIRIQGNNKYLTVGASNQIGVVHTGGEAYITNSSGHFTHRSDVHKWENYAGSAQYLRIDSSGNVIVNNTTAAAGSYTYKLLASDNISSTEQTFGIQYPGVVTYGLNAESNSDFTIKKDGAERLRIDSDGRLLIGINASGQADANLQVFRPTGTTSRLQVGNVATSASGVAGIDFCPSNKVMGSRIECQAQEDFSTSANRTAELVFFTRHNGTSSEKVRITSGGSVGIGLTNPEVQYFNNLVVGNNVAGDKGITIRSNSGNSGILAFSDTDAADANRYDGYIRYSHADQHMSFYTALGNKRFTINEYGYVGVNTTQHSINGMSRYLSVSARNITNGGSAIEIVGNRTGSDQTLGVINFVNDASNVAQITAKYQGSTTNGSLQFFTSGSERLRISSDGRLTSTRSTTTAYDAAATTNDSQVVILSSGAAGHATLQFQSLSGGTAQTGQATISAFNESNGSKDTALTFGTRQNSDATIRERLRITSAGRVGINETSPDALLHIKDTNPRIILEGTNGSGRQHEIWSAGGNSQALQFTSGELYYNADIHVFRASNETTQYGRFDTGGRLLINKTTNRDKYFNGTYTGQLQVEGTNDSTRLTQFVHNSNNNSGHIFVIGKSRGTSVGSYNIVQNNDYLGTISFQGADGDEMVDGARIEARVNNGNGDPGNDDMPTDLIFRTNQGHSSPRETLRITSRGQFLRRQQGYSNSYQQDNFGTAMYIKGGWLRFSSSFNNPTKDLVILEDGGTANHGLYIKVTVMHLDYPGTDYGVGNIHIGYASAKRKGDSSGQWHVDKSNMALESGSNFHGQNGNVGTLAWSDSNPSDTNTLSYTPNRHANYDQYHVQVEVWQRGNCLYYLHSDFVE